MGVEGRGLYSAHRLLPLTAPPLLDLTPYRLLLFYECRAQQGSAIISGVTEVERAHSVGRAVTG